MALRFIGQPFVGGGQIGEAVTDAMRRPDATALWFAVAWAKQSGVSRIWDAASDFHAAGGTSEVIVGIDEGGASPEGLELCLQAFDRVFVYHDPGTPTFHPKIYAVEAPDRATVVVGSGNLTMGGLFKNYEAALVLETERGDEDWAVRDDARAYFDSLLAGGEALRVLDQALIDLLEQEGWITSEANQNRRRASQSGQRRERAKLFGNPVRGLAGAPRPSVAPLPDEEEDEDTPLPLPPPPEAPLPAEPPATAPSPAPTPSSPPTVVYEWTKPLSPSDAQQRSRAGTNPIGNLRLTQAGNPIDHRTFFRRDLFGPATWAPSNDRRGNPIELATIPFEVEIGGSALGTYNLVVDHAPHRESGQANHLTVLHWGTDLRQRLRATDYSGHLVRLARLSDGSYRLEVR